MFSLVTLSCAPASDDAGSGANKIKGSEIDSAGSAQSPEIKSGNGAGEFSCDSSSRSCIGSVLARTNTFTEEAVSDDSSSTNLVAATCDFSRLIPLRGTEKDAAPFLKACIKSTPAGGVVAIPAGTYTLYSYLTIDRGITLTTAGIPITAPGCQVTGACAVLRAGLTMQGLLDPKTRVGFLFRIAGTGTTIHHIVFDARKPARSDVDRKLCATSGGIGWVGFWNTCADCKFTKNVVTNALCSSNMVVEEAIRSEISHSVFSNAGTHGSRVADGLTILHAAQSNISYNQFSNNADIDLVLGECPGCMIEMNRVTHYDNPAGDPWLSSAFGGIFLNAWPGTSGDYTGAILRDNYVDGGPSRSIGQGIAFGTYQWQFIFKPDPAMIKLGWTYPPRPTRGFTAYNNFVTNSQAGFVINKDVAGGNFGDNYASAHTGNNACIVSGGMRRDLYSYVVTPGALVTFTGKNVGQAYFANADYHNQYPNDAPGCVTKPTNVKPAPNAAGAQRIFRHIIKELYTEHLGRDAEPAAYANLLPQFAAGSATQLSLRDSILGSNEYCQKWLRGQYQRFLKRLPEPAAYTNWCGQITAKKITFDQVANIIANSPEAIAKR